MPFSAKPLNQQTIVITGASSGIGLATALAAAERGARVVLVSRNGEVLAEIERRINGSRGRAIHVVADVSRREDVQRVATVAVERLGGFDTWVNGAGLGIWGRLEQVSDADHRRLFDTNFWGVVYGSLVAVAHLKRHGGTLINLGSVVSDVAIPLQGMYSASKHAIKGFTNALRIELEQEGAPVRVTLVKPAAINTPFPHHARNYTDREPKLPPPLYAPEEVAHAILHAATHRVRDVFVGGGGKAMSALNERAPRISDRYSLITADQQLSDEPPRNPEGALHRAGDDGQVHGDAREHVRQTSLYTRASLNPGVAGAVLAASVAAGAWLVAGRSKRR